MARFAIVSPLDGTNVESDAGWSSLAARRAHNPKVRSSILLFATKPKGSVEPFLFSVSFLLMNLIISSILKHVCDNQFI